MSAVLTQTGFVDDNNRTRPRCGSCFFAVLDATKRHLTCTGAPPVPVLLPSQRPEKLQLTPASSYRPAAPPVAMFQAVSASGIPAWYPGCALWRCVKCHVPMFDPEAEGLLILDCAGSVEDAKACPTFKDTETAP